MLTIAELTATVPQRGRVEAILVRPGHREDVIRVESVEALAGRGLAGDRHGDRDPARAGERQVTLIQAEHLDVVGALLGAGGPADPALLRRNIVVSGIPLIALKGLRFRVGDAVLEGTGPCQPCSRMEEALGAGGYQAMRGHGGLTAIIVTGGELAIGDAVSVL